MVLSLGGVLVLGLKLGGLIGIADVEGFVGLFGGFEGADAFVSVPIALAEDGVFGCGFAFAPGDPGIHAGA